MSTQSKRDLESTSKSAVEAAVSRALTADRNSTGSAAKPKRGRNRIASDSDSDSLKDFELPTRNIRSSKRKAATR